MIEISEKIFDAIYTMMAIDVLNMIIEKEYNPENEIELKSEIEHARNIIDEIIDEMERKEIIKVDWENEDGQPITLTRKEIYEWQNEIYES